MPLHRDSSSSGRRSRGGIRPDNLHVNARVCNADGVLILYADEGEPLPGAAPQDPMPDDGALTQLRTERDTALEEVAYLKEQLCSLSAYHSHLLDEERRRMFDERTQLATQLASLREELQGRTYLRAGASWSPRGPLAAVSDADVIGTR